MAHEDLAYATYVNEYSTGDLIFWELKLLKSRYPEIAESDKNLVFFQRPSMLAGKFDEARKHAHSSLQILSRHLPKVVKQFKTFKELPKIAKQFETLVNARQISYTDIK